MPSTPMRHNMLLPGVLFCHTNPKRIATAFAAAQARQMMVDLLELPGLRILTTPALAMLKLIELLRRHPITGAAIFDLQIVATMQANNVLRICTFNRADFQIFPDLQVIAP